VTNIFLEPFYKQYLMSFCAMLTTSKEKEFKKKGGWMK